MKLNKRNARNRAQLEPTCFCDEMNLTQRDPVEFAEQLKNQQKACRMSTFYMLTSTGMPLSPKFHRSSVTASESGDSR